MSHKEVVEKCGRGSEKGLADVNEPRSKGCGVREAPRSRRGGETWGTRPSICSWVENFWLT